MGELTDSFICKMNGKCAFNKTVTLAMYVNKHTVWKWKNICISATEKNWVDFLPRMHLMYLTFTALALQMQKSNSVTALKDSSQGQREVTKVYKVHTTAVYKKWSYKKPESQFINHEKKTVMELEWF